MLLGVVIPALIMAWNLISASIWKIVSFSESRNANRTSLAYAYWQGPGHKAGRAIPFLDPDDVVGSFNDNGPLLRSWVRRGFFRSSFQHVLERNRRPIELLPSTTNLVRYGFIRCRPCGGPLSGGPPVSDLDSSFYSHRNCLGGVGGPGSGVGRIFGERVAGNSGSSAGAAEQFCGATWISAVGSLLSLFQFLFRDDADT